MTVFIIAACRSAVAPRGGAFAPLVLHDLAAPVIRHALAVAGVQPEQVGELILSNALGPGGNPARSVALAAGLPERIAGLSIDRQCAGGMDAILLARHMILSEDADIVIAGGVESYSRRPERWRTFADGRAPEFYDQAPFTPWPGRDPDMAEAAAALGIAKGIDKASQDAWAIQSHDKAIKAAKTTAEITPVNGLSSDPYTRTLTAALCRRAKPVAGDVTTANTAVAADAAAFCVLVSERVARQFTGPVARMLGGVTLGGDPTCPGLAPVAAVDAILDRVRIAPAQLAASEVMEAYAVQAIACIQGSGLDPTRVNIGGGALARGHPIGASGAINTVRLFHELTGQGGAGLAAIAAAGGIGTALVLEA